MLIIHESTSVPRNLKDRWSGHTIAKEKDMLLMGWHARKHFVQAETDQ